MNNVATLTLRRVVAEVRKGNLPVNGKITIDGKQFNVKDCDISYANLVKTAEKFIENYIKEHGTKSFLSERFRNGFIGEEVHTVDGTSYIQSTRGRPYGTVVSIPVSDDREIVYGVSFIANEDKDRSNPIVGQYLALLKALENVKENKPLNLKSKAVKQFEHYVLRSKAYFYPDKYSYSRGKTPIEYPDYDKIKARRDLILGK